MGRTQEAVHVTARRIPSLDGIRGVAILVVVIHNASFILGPSDRFSLKLLGAMTSTGWAGVELFFVLSGFLITGILIDTRRSEHYFQHFYVRRVLRIFPLYYVFLAVAFGIAPHLADASWSAMARQNQGWYWLYMSNWSGPFGRSVVGLPHFWSLAVEEQFYLLWPFLVYALSWRRLVALCVAAIATTPFIRLALHLAGFPPSAGYEFTIARWDALAGGALLALLMAEDSPRTWLATRMSYIGRVGLVALAGLLLYSQGFYPQDLEVLVVGQSITVVLFGWLVHVGVAPASLAQRTVRDALETRWLRFLGKYSYAIYVLHYPIHTVASRYMRAAINGPDDPWRILRWASYVGGVGMLSILAALGSWYLLEKWFLDLKDRLAPRVPPARTLDNA